jgi:hypothetical protein
MGWANCGEDSNGRPIGYAHEATCDHPGCSTKIDRGLSYACGDMHGENEFDCDGYFCSEHLTTAELPEGSVTVSGRDWITVCFACAERIETDERVEAQGVE